MALLPPIICSLLPAPGLEFQALGSGLGLAIFRFLVGIVNLALAVEPLVELGPGRLQGQGEKKEQQQAGYIHVWVPVGTRSGII